MLPQEPVLELMACSPRSLILHRDTRQGCPFSPLLFAIAVEPLACLFCHSSDVSGLVRGSLEEKIPLYVDNTLLFINHTPTSLPVVMQQMSLEGSRGWGKSMLLPIDPLPPSLAHLNVVPLLKYLGVNKS